MNPSLPRLLLQDCGVAATDTHHEVTEGTVDVLTATLESGVMRGIYQFGSQVSGLKRFWIKFTFQCVLHFIYIAEFKKLYTFTPTFTDL